MQFEVRLVHAEAGRRVVEARALEQGQLLGMALGEGGDAEDAEDRALARLCQRLGKELPAPPDQPAPLPPEASGGAPLDRPASGERGRKDGSPINARQGGAAGLPQGDADSQGLRPDAGEASAPLPVSAAGIPGPITPPPRAVGALHQTGATLPDLSSGAPAAKQLPTPITPSGNAAAQKLSREPEEAPPSDPEDWSAELTRLDLELRRIGWGREQEGQYLQRAFGHPSRSRLTRYADLLAYLRRLEGLESSADPLLAPVPLRRRDLLEQGDGLLQQLGWDGERARSFSEAQLGVRSRRQLSDEQLLQFNMLLESELLERARLQDAVGEADSGPAAERNPAA